MCAPNDKIQTIIGTTTTTTVRELRKQIRIPPNVLQNCLVVCEWFLRVRVHGYIAVVVVIIIIIIDFF